MFKQCLENRVVNNDAGYKCYLCHITTERNFELIKSHIETQGHIKKINLINNEQKKKEQNILDSISEQERKTLCENCVTFTNNNLSGLNFKCHLCKCEVSGLMNIFQHVRGRFHKDIVKADNCNNIVGINLLQGANNNKNINISTTTVKNVDTTSDKFLSKILYCEPCKCPLKSETSVYCHVMVHVYQELNLSTPLDIIKCKQYKKNDKTIIKCLICNTFLESIVDLESHLITEVHKSRYTFFKFINHAKEKKLTQIQSMIDDNINIPSLDKVEKAISKNIVNYNYCKLCCIDVINNSKSINNHISSRSHNSNIENWKSDPKVTSLPSELYGKLYFCFICQTSFVSLTNLIQHINENPHKLKMKCLDMIYKNDFLNFVENNERILKTKVSCKSCNRLLNNGNLAVQHLFGESHAVETKLPNIQNRVTLESSNTNVNIVTETHSSKVKNISPVNTDTIKAINLELLCKSVESTIAQISYNSKSLKPSDSKASCSQNIDDLLDGLIDMNLNAKVKSRLPNSRQQQNSPTSPSVQSKINTFNRNVMLYGKSYIMHCIEPGPENIYTIDIEKIHLIKMGTSLIYPSGSKYICIPCGVALEIDKQLVFEHIQDIDHIRKLKTLEYDNEEFLDFPDQFSDLRLAQLYMVDEDEKWINCLACKVKVNNDNTDIRLHSEMPTHIQISQNWKQLSKILCDEYLSIFENIWYYAQVFICEVCKNKCDYEIDFIKHLNNPNHAKKVEKKELDGFRYKYEFCHVCITYWFGNDKSHKIHCEENLFHKRFAKNGDFKVPKMFPMTEDLLDNVDIKINCLINENHKMNFEKHKEFELLNSIENTVKHQYSNAKAYTFGSRLSNLGFPDSDVDVFLDCQNLYYKSTTQEESKNYLLSVEQSFKQNSDIWIIDETLLSTRVPIIKLRYIPNGLKCDISFINGLSVEKSTLVGEYNEAYPICRHLILFMKKWLTTCKLAGSDCITTFAMSWLVIYYLQLKGILPSVHDLICLKSESKIVDGWECGFIRPIPVKSSKSSFKDHLKEFLHFYANFDYKTYVICPYLGIEIEKKAFAYPQILPYELELYKRRMNDDHSLTFRFDSPMCIQDPIDLSQNMTKAVKKLQLRCFKQYCKESYAKL